ncbi:energy transducer TonB [Foetidibacter luteolus]|uniref:energy transducer TonB n=1 Tax=Foetidibacter luteolus TaxID=2608880 RepID=UPI00129ADA82|nr:energy transducer TonB [Foetidibacter luteolus]
MEANKILQADVLDILFEHRNKDYGAYDLRKSYNKRVTYALSGMGLMCLLLIGASIFANSSRNEKPQTLVGPDVVLADVPKEKPREEVKVTPPPKQTVQQVAQKQFTNFKIEKDENVKENEMPPDNASLENIKIGTINRDGKIDDAVTPLVENTGFGTVKELGKEEKYNDVFTRVQIEAKFPGGAGEWIKFLERNLRTEVPVENGASPGKYTVFLSFIVDKDGNLSEIKAENDPGYGVAEEAIRVIKRGPKWIPAVQNGRNVIYRQKQSISFIVEEGQ